MKTTALAAFFLVLLSAPMAFCDVDVLLERAYEHHQWANTYNLNPYGSVGYVYFEDPGSFEINRYSFGDSTIWTGTYLAAEAFRYGVTGEEEAKENAIRTVHALDAHLRITQVPGFIARVAAPDEPPYNTGYTTHSRYVQGTGEWEGSFWINNTSRDQYTGWFFGMATAYDLIDDEPTRELIREDVKTVIDELRTDGYWIIGENGLPTDAGPHALETQRLTWHLIAAHVLDDPAYWELYAQLFEEYKDSLRLDNFSWFNKYMEYYGFNLAHENFFTLLRLERDPDRRAFYLDIFYRAIRKLVHYTHNVFFDVIYLSQCERAGACQDFDDHLADVKIQLFDFQDPPVREIPKTIPDWPLDPLSVILSDFVDQYNLRWLADFDYQTLDPRPVLYRCPRSFMWQKTPYNIDCPGGDGTEVYPGVDYMVAYWMGRYYSFIDPGNENEVYWPPDNTYPDDDDDDDSTDDDTSDDDDISDDDAQDDDDDQGPLSDSDDDDDDNGCCG